MSEKIQTMIDKEIRLGELRATTLSADDGKMVVEGYAAVFEQKATYYGFTEWIAKGAFDGCDMRDVALRYNHQDTWLIIARTRNNSLTLTVDDKGLAVRAELIDTQTNRDVYTSIKAGLLDKMSFAFSVALGGEEWDWEANERMITKIKRTYDVSVVDHPFYEGTEIYARAIGELESHRSALESEKSRQVEVQRLKTQILMM